MLVDCIAPPTLWPARGERNGSAVLPLGPPPPPLPPQAEEGCYRDSFNCYSPSTATLGVTGIVVPLACMRTLGSIVRLNSVGPIFLMYLLFFICVESTTDVAPNPLVKKIYNQVGSGLRA